MGTLRTIARMGGDQSDPPKLSAEDLHAIRLSTLSLIKLAEQFNISTTVAREIRTGSRWWVERNSHGE